MSICCDGLGCKECRKPEKVTASSVERLVMRNCPFCGGEDIEVDPLEHSKYDDYGEFVHGYYSVWCGNGECDITGPVGNTPEEAVEKWNIRA